MKTAEEIIGLIDSLLDDEVSKKVALGLKEVSRLIKGEEEVTLKKDKTATIMETLVENENIDPYIRTQLWDIVALIEQL